MNEQTKLEIQKAQQYLQGDGPYKHLALIGLNDWFWQGMIEDEHMNCEIIGPDVPRKGHPRFYALLEELADLHERKNQNYATDEDPLKNLRDCQGLGIEPFKGTLVRLCDKWARIKNLANGVPDKVGESIIDTLRDMAIYSLLAIILWEEKHATQKTANATSSHSPTL